eukprot:5701904-Alexandrium_andersonii.AAC.1
MPGSHALSSAGPNDVKPSSARHGSSGRLAGAGNGEDSPALDLDEPLLALAKDNAQRPGSQVSHVVREGRAGSLRDIPGHAWVEREIARRRPRHPSGSPAAGD